MQNQQKHPGLFFAISSDGCSAQDKHREFKLVSLMYRTQGAEGSQPAMKIRRSEVSNKTCKIKDVNVCMNVMYNKYE